MSDLPTARKTDHVFARTFGIYFGCASLALGLVALILAYASASTVWTARFDRLGTIDGPAVGLLYESIRLFLIVVLGLATICWGFPEEVADLLRFRSLPTAISKEERREEAEARQTAQTQPIDKRIVFFRALLFTFVIALAVWKSGEVFQRDVESPAANLLQWGIVPESSSLAGMVVQDDPAVEAVIREPEMNYAELQRHFRKIQTTYVLYLPCTLISYAFIVPLAFVIPLYSVSCTDRNKLGLFHYHRLLASQEPVDEILAGLKRIRAHCFRASQRYLYLCAALGIVFVYTQFDPTLGVGSRNALRYVFYVLVGGSALAVLRLWGHYYGAWQLTLNYLVDHCESTTDIQEELSPLQFGKELVMQTPQGIVAAALISPAFQEMIARVIGG